MKTHIEIKENDLLKVNNLMSQQLNELQLKEALKHWEQVKFDRELGEKKALLKEKLIDITCNENITDEEVYVFIDHMYWCWSHEETNTLLKDIQRFLKRGEYLDHETVIKEIVENKFLDMADAYDFQSEIIPDEFEASFIYKTSCGRYYRKRDGYFYEAEEKQHDEKDLKEVIKKLTGKTYPEEGLIDMKGDLEYYDIPLEKLGYITSQKIRDTYLEENESDCIDAYFSSSMYMTADIKGIGGYFYIPMF